MESCRRRRPMGTLFPPTISPSRRRPPPASTSFSGSASATCSIRGSGSFPIPPSISCSSQEPSSSGSGTGRRPPSLIVLFGAYWLQAAIVRIWGGYCPPGRLAIPVIWVPALFVAEAFAADKTRLRSAILGGTTGPGVRGRVCRASATPGSSTTIISIRSYRGRGPSIGS